MSTILIAASARRCCRRRRVPLCHRSHQGDERPQDRRFDADAGVRGTEFWGGPLEKHGVLLLEGEVSVSNQAGSVVLATSGQGTDIASALDPPGGPKAWPKEKVARAIATVALH
jgi:hypothetical protein